MNNRGITLTALVVTIIVLLIISGVSLYYAINDNGIITHALRVANEVKESNLKENEALLIINDVDKSDQTTDIVKDDLEYNLEDINSRNLKIGGFVRADFLKDANDVEGGIEFSNEYLKHKDWTTKTPGGWRILSAGKQIKLISTGTPLTYRIGMRGTNSYFLKNGDLREDFSNEIANGNKDGFVKSSFSVDMTSNKLIFGGKSIFRVFKFTIKELISTYFYLSGNNNLTYQTLKFQDFMQTHLFTTESLYKQSGNKMSENYADDLLCNGYYYLIEGYSGSRKFGDIWSNYRSLITNKGEAAFGTGYEFGVRPIIVLRESVYVERGTGTEADPYILKDSNSF